MVEGTEQYFMKFLGGWWKNIVLHAYIKFSRQRLDLSKNKWLKKLL